MRSEERRNQPPPILNWGRYRFFGLFLLAFFALRFGIIYTPLSRVREVPSALRFITALFPDARPGWEPVWILGGMWMIAAAGAVAAMVVERIHNAASITVVLLTLYWTAAYAIAALVEHSLGDLFMASLFLLAAGMVIYIGLTSRPAERIELESVELVEVTHRVD